MAPPRRSRGKKPPTLVGLSKSMALNIKICNSNVHIVVKMRYIANELILTNCSILKPI